MGETILEFYYRKDNNAPQSTYGEGCPRVYDTLFYSCLFFMALYWSLPRVIKAVYPKFYEDLGEQKQSELSSWAAGLAHHYVVPIASVYMIYLDFIRPKEELKTMDYAKDFWGIEFLAYSFGYILADTLYFSIPDMFRGQFMYFIHHAPFLFMMPIILKMNGAFLRMIPHFLICESSNAVFSTTWFVRNAGGRDSALVGHLEKLFVLLFFILRIVHFPIVLHSMLSLDSTQEYLTYWYIALAPIAALQVFWMYKIVMSMLKKLAVPSSDDKKK